MSLLYSIDTSALIAAWEERYPPDIFPAMWEPMAELFDSATAGCVDEVQIELSKKSGKDDDLFKWAKSRNGMFHPLDAGIQIAAKSILANPKHCKLVNTIKGRGRADPFVIAFAKARGLTVVTEEKSAPKKIKIPDVCRDLSVPCIDLVGLFRKQRWKF